MKMMSNAASTVNRLVVSSVRGHCGASFTWTLFNHGSCQINCGVSEEVIEDLLFDSQEICLVVLPRTVSDSLGELYLL